MALFNAVRRYIEPRGKGGSQEENGKHDGIVVVGDGNTREWCSVTGVVNTKYREWYR